MIKEKINNLGIYIHFPFCMRRCFFCCFVSKITTYELLSPRRDNNYQDDYTKKIIEQIKNTKSDMLAKKQKIVCIHIGGGTPSLWDISNVDKVLKAIEDKYKTNRAEINEINIEIAPEFSNISYISKLKKIGFNRISFGVQSFNKKIIETVGRDYEINKAYKLISKSCNIFDNINVDLIWGLPGETKESWSQTLDKLFSLEKIDHFTATHFRISKAMILKKLGELKIISFPNEKSLNKMNKITNTKALKNNFINYLGHNLYCRNNKKFIGEAIFKSTSMLGNIIGYGEGAISHINGKSYIGTYYKNKIIHKRPKPYKENLMQVYRTHRMFLTSDFSEKNWEKIFNRNFYNFLEKNPLLKKKYHPEKYTWKSIKFQNEPSSVKVASILEKNHKELLINNKKCLSCGLCKKSCPNNAITIDDYGRYHIDNSICNKCKTYFPFCMCILICPNEAISSLE